VRGAGGAIDFESRPGAGSRVVVRIPFDRPGRTEPANRGTAT